MYFGRAISKGGSAPATRLVHDSGGLTAREITAANGTGAATAFSCRVPAAQDGAEEADAVCSQRLSKEDRSYLAGSTTARTAKRLRETRAESYNAATGRAVIGLRIFEELRILFVISRMRARTMLSSDVASLVPYSFWMKCSLNVKSVFL